MQINIGTGLNNINFGIKQEQLIALLGEPDKINPLDQEQEGKVIVYYNDLRAKFKFDKDEEMKLYAIEVFHPEALLFGEKLIDKSSMEIIEALKAKGYEKLAYENYKTFNTIFCETIWMTFQFEFDLLTGIEFSPLFDENEQIVWPK
ncbi:hypothetical protein KAR48_15115 [bacterium]|nr:hypothetical protein [bacterium]